MAINTFGTLLESTTDALCGILPDASGKTCMVRTCIGRHAISTTDIYFDICTVQSLYKFTNGGVISPAHFPIIRVTYLPLANTLDVFYLS